MVLCDTFYSYFIDAIVVWEKEQLSAKWRRSKKYLRGFDLSRFFDKIKGKGTFRVRADRNSTRRATLSTRQGIQVVRAERKIRDPEPLVDVLDQEGRIVVVAEIVGFSKDNLQVHARTQSLTLSAMTSTRKYYKSLNLPKRVIPSTMRTTYKNGVLEIQLRKAVENKTVDKMA